MKIRSVIADDEKSAVEGMQQLLSEFCTDVEIAGTATNVIDTVRLVRELQPDVLFLDIEMPPETGFDVLNELGEEAPVVIFVTAYNHYAIRALRENAFDYLLKPVSIDDLRAAVERVREKQTAPAAFGQAERLTISTTDGFYFVSTAEIIRVEASGSYSELHLADGRKIVASRNIGHFERLLKKRGFFRAHNSHLLNLSMVKKFLRRDGYFVEMQDNSIVEISRRKKDEFLEAMG
ncbi:MAG: LytTR family two component transcriptional regulator [Bacteroidetes bacterium]|nr:MAG: LytTR family two component transcriptional regulator [Bacteroidota bacterium]